MVWPANEPSIILRYVALRKAGVVVSRPANGFGQLAYPERDWGSPNVSLKTSRIVASDDNGTALFWRFAKVPRVPLEISSMYQAFTAEPDEPIMKL